jgi:hypothetical protein
MNAVLIRSFQNKVKTLGDLVIFDDAMREIFKCKTLELGWNNNERRISCIPEGVYEVVPRKSKKYGEHYHITNVENRDWILIHHGNFTTDILGCILVGKAHKDINGDKITDVTSSVATMNKLRKAVGENSFKIKITKKQ